MAKQTFGSKTFAAWTFRNAAFTGLGVEGAAVIARQGTGERRHAYDFGDDDPAPPRRIIRIPQAKKPERKRQPATTTAERTPRPAPIPLWAEPKRDIADADFERPSRWNAAQDEDELLLLGVL